MLSTVMAIEARSITYAAMENFCDFFALGVIHFLPDSDHPINPNKCVWDLQQQSSHQTIITTFPLPDVSQNPN